MFASFAVSALKIKSYPQRTQRRYESFRQTRHFQEWTEQPDRLVLLLGLLGFCLALLFLEEFLEPVNQAAASADHVQTAFLLVLFQNPVQATFEIAHGYTSQQGRFTY